MFRIKSILVENITEYWKVTTQLVEI